LLTHVKALIWIHSVIGAGLVIAFFAVLYRDLWGSTLVVACGIPWYLALGPIEKRASALRPADRTPATGLPGWVLIACSIGQVSALMVGEYPHLEWLIVGHLLVGGTLLFRGLLSVFYEVPLNRRTWGVCMILLGVGLVRHLVAAFFMALAGV